MISVILAKVLLYLLLNKSAAGVVVNLRHILWCCCNRLSNRLFDSLCDRLCDRFYNGLLLSDCHVSHSGGCFGLIHGYWCGLGWLSLHGWHRSCWRSGTVLWSTICSSILTSPFICRCHLCFIPVVCTLLHNACDASFHRTLYMTLHFLLLVPA